MTYLFVGEDEFSKDIKLQKIKQGLFSPQLESFNSETLYAKELDLRTLQEKLLQLPVKAKQRLILIKSASKLRPDVKEYLLSYIRKPFSHVVLVLDARRVDRRDSFFNRISGPRELINFRESIELNAFTLSRQVLQRRIKPALRLLRKLLLKGEKPEKILGAIRYQLNQERLGSEEKKKKLWFLLNCDIDIKTGRLKPDLALERLLLRLCYF
jgi:DNA polymerase III delta subunit